MRVGGAGSGGARARAAPAAESESEPAPRTSPAGTPSRTRARSPSPNPPSAATAIDPGSVADGAVIGAAIDVGANSIHLLVAAVAGHRVEPLLDESVFLGLGDRVARDGKIGPEARRDVVNALASYAATASRLGAKEITIVGTEPIRRAFDATALVGEVEARADISLHVLDHDEEAMLTLLGVTRGRACADGHARRRHRRRQLRVRHRRARPSGPVDRHLPGLGPADPGPHPLAIRRRPPRSTPCARSRAPRSLTPRMPTRGT